MQFVSLHDKREIERFLRKDVYLHIYGIGDLDDFFWPYTIWYGLRTDANLESVALLYVGQALPALLALSRQGDAMQELLRSISHLLPDRFSAHLSPGLETVLGGTHDLQPHGEHYKMALPDVATLSGYDCPGVTRLSKQDLDEIREFYEESYQDNWFDPRMLETDQYFGIRKETRLVSIAGIHVYSPDYRVAALGNIATLPSRRNCGYGRQVTARLCQSLVQEVDHIGLNVKADNKAAISCYEKLGFEIVASYGEFLVQRNSPER
ncbi:MAG: GNAT family N-acetyltransferase [Planctomycetota bacterium]